MSGALNWVGQTIGDSYGPGGFEPLALLSPQLRESWAAARKARLDALEAQAEDVRVTSYLKMGQAVQHDASAAIESGNFDQAAALSRQSGELSATALRNQIARRGEVGGVPADSGIGQIVGQGNEAIASAEGQRRAGGMTEEILARGQQMQAARTELGQKSGAPASSQFVTPGQAGAFATNAASSREAGLQQRQTNIQEAGLRRAENIRSEGVAAAQFKSNLAAKQAVDIDTAKREARITRRNAIRLDKERTLTPRQFNTFMDNVSAGADADPAIFDNNPRLKTMAVVGKAMGSLGKEVPAALRNKVLMETLDAAQGVTRQQTQAISGQTAAEIAKDQNYSIDAIVQMETTKGMAEDSFFGVTGDVGDVAQGMLYFKVKEPEWVKSWIDRRTTWRLGNAQIEKDALLDVAATTFTDEVREWVKKNLVASEDDGSLLVYNSKINANIRYQTYKAAGFDAFRVQNNGNVPTPFEAQLITSRALARVAEELGQPAPPPPQITPEQAQAELERRKAAGGAQ